MIIVCLITVILLQASLLGGLYYAYRKVDNEVMSAHTWLSTFFADRGEGQGSFFTEAVGNISEDFSQRVGVTVQAAIRGSRGGQMKGVNSALEQVAVEENPELGLLEALPKSLRKNPIAMLGLQALTNRMRSQAQGTPGTNGHQSSQTRFNL